MTENDVTLIFDIARHVSTQHILAIEADIRHRMAAIGKSQFADTAVVTSCAFLKRFIELMERDMGTSDAECMQAVTAILRSDT